MDTLETLICMVYNTKGMVSIAARMMEKIHLEGKQVEQKGTPFFVWFFKAYGSLGGRGFSRTTAGNGLIIYGGQRFWFANLAKNKWPPY